MNRIYKVIWSKVKHQYVVVSELAHRDGKRSSAATTSRATWRALAVALMLTSSLAAVPYMGYALDGGTATQSQYIAVAMEPEDGAGHYESHFKWGEGWVKEWVPDNSRKFGNYTYYLQTVTVNGEPKQYWVREGYDITVTQNQARYPSINQGTDYIIDAQKNEDYTEQSDQGLLQAYQTTTSAGDITTLTGVNIEDLNTGVYGGASNTAGVETPSNWGYHIQVGGTGSDSEGYLKVSDDLDGTSSGRPAGATGNTNFDTYFSHNVTLQNGVYVYTDREGKTVNVPTNKVYSIDGELGVFTDANGNLYTGDVYGDNNEILLSGVGEGNQIYTYWGTKLTDPTQTIGNMTVEHYNKDRIELQQQSAAYHGDDIKDITVNQNENGGSFSFNRLGKYNKNTGKYEDADPAGVITIKNTATSGKSGNDVAIEFSNGTDSFTVQAGSKVEGTTGEASGDTLTGLSINGVDYKLGGGKSVTSGSINTNGTINLKQGEDDNTGITLSGKLHDYALDDQDQTAKEGKVTLTGTDWYGEDTYDITIDGLVTTDTLGDQIAGSNNLKVTAGDKGRWTITDTSKPEGEQVFTNTTLEDSVDKKGDKDSGYTYTVSDTAGNTAVIDDVASAAKLTEVNTSVTNLGTRVSTVEGDMITGGTIKDDGTITLSQQDKGTVSLTGKIHDYALDDQDQTAKEGKVTLTGTDRYGEDTYDITIDGLVTTDTVGDIIATKNNLIVAADADGDDNKGNWTITDTSKPVGQQNVFTNTTLDKANSTSTPIGTVDNIYGQSFTVADTAGNQFTIRDIASAKKLAEVDSLAVKYGTKDGDVDPTIIELMNPYLSEGHSGGTSITNVAYADINGNGSAAVNVDLLKDTVANVMTTVTANEKHIATNVGTTPDVKGGQFSVKDGKITLVEVDGNGNTTGNAVVIDNVASASDLGDVTDIHEGLLNKDENGNTMDTSVVDAVNNLDDKVGDGDFSDTTYAKNETGDTSVTDAIHNLDDAINSATTIAGQHSSVSGSDNITVAPNGTNEAGGTDYKVTLKDDLTLGGKEGQGPISIKGSEGTINATGNISAGSFSTGNITINKDNSGTINGLSNKTWDANNIISGQAATEDQLKAATEAAVQYDRNEDGSVNKESISLGYQDEKGNQHLTQIHNVAAGSAPTDAVNVGQLSAVGDLAINNYNNIQVLNGSINKLDNRIDRVGAGAAALAALHPLDFDPDAKWDFAAGYGNYRGANAVAVGAYYRPNEDVMFSVGGSMGGGENMVNAGVSFKLGAGSSHVTTSRVAMAKEIKSMRDIVAKQDAQIQKLTAMVNVLVGIQAEPDTTTMFPDVPENHWAYEAVAAMAKGGLVKGYPDGEFKGDRTMTRYEFAQIVYNAIQAGAEVDSRLVAEFQPELEYFHVATIDTDKNGNPTIQRVRANNVSATK